MEFQVPQFIDIEDKVFGPLTVKQFVYLVGGAGLSYVLYRLLPIFISLVLIAVVIVFSLSLAFYRPNRRSFVDVLESAFNFFVSKKLYVWKKRFRSTQESEEKEEDLTSFVTDTSVPKLSDSRLSELSWSLDVKDKIIEKQKE